jgi:hypothetical protein
LEALVVQCSAWQGCLMARCIPDAEQQQCHQLQQQQQQ